MTLALEWLRLLLPWLALFGFVIAFYWLIGWARNRRATAFVIGAFFQMILPDPFAERTIEVVQDRKREVVKKQDENGDPPDQQTS